MLDPSADPDPGPTLLHRHTPTFSHVSGSCVFIAPLEGRPEDAGLACCQAAAALLPVCVNTVDGEDCRASGLSTAESETLIT